MFEKAARLKLRFETNKGSLDVEDLFDLPLTSARGQANLNDIAKGLNRELKSAGEEDFVNNTSKVNEVLQLKFDLVKHIIEVRLAENETAKIAADKKATKARLLELLAKKQDQKLEAASEEEILAKIAEL